MGATPCRMADCEVIDPVVLAPIHGVILHPSGDDGQPGIATKSHKKPQKRAAPKPTPLRGLCALCVKSSHAKLAKNAKKLEWPGRRRRVGVATNKESARTDFRALCVFRGNEFHSRGSPPREGVFPALRPSLSLENAVPHAISHHALPIAYFLFSVTPTPLFEGDTIPSATPSASI